MKLNISERSTEKKREPRRIRREGKVPAVIYAKEGSSKAIQVEEAELAAFLRSVKPGHLPSTVVKIADGQGRERRALIKDIQYHPTTYRVLHVDFEELSDQQPVNVKVPVECTGVVDCTGVKLGGILRQVLRHVKVSCLPKDIPSCFEVDVKELGIAQSKRVADLNIPKAIRPLVNPKEVVVLVAKR